MNTINNDSSRPDATDHDMSRHVGISRDSDLAKELPKDGCNSHDHHELSNDKTSRALSRPDTTGHDNTRYGATERDKARQVATEQDVESESMNDARTSETHDSQPEPSEPDSLEQNSFKPGSLESGAMEQSSLEQSSWIEIEQTVHELEQQGIKRTVRSIQRYCQKGRLTCKLIPTENAVRYLIERSSIDAFVKQHNQTMPTVGFGASPQGRHAPVEPGSPQQTEAIQAQITQSNQHSEIILSLKDKQIDMLTSQLAVTNKQLDMKDEQISALLERDHETNFLIQNLQNLVALPSGGPSASHSREASPDSSRPDSHEYPANTG